jgi:hypothetical protein
MLNVVRLDRSGENPSASTEQLDDPTSEARFFAD